MRRDPKGPNGGKDQDRPKTALGLALIGTPRGKAQIAAFEEGLRLLTSLGITASIAVSPAFLVERPGFCQGVEKTGMDWIASPYWGFLSDETLDHWTHEAIKGEAEDAIRLYFNIGLQNPVGLLVPDIRSGSKLTSAMKRMNPSIEFFTPGFDFPHEWEFSSIPGALCVHHLGREKKGATAPIGIALDTGWDEFYPQLQLLALQCDQDSTYSLTRMGDLIASGGSEPGGSRPMEGT